ncbi:hypothetical protein CCP2SC5_420031 [Azospirillaceae bacterium]
MSAPSSLGARRRSSRVTGAGATAFRLPDFERALAEDFRPEALHGIAASSEGLNNDIHADAAYRAHLIGIMVRRAVAAACGPGRE